MARRIHPDRLFDARRSAHVSRLRNRGVPEDRAEAWCDAWEAEAARRCIPRDEATYWSQGGDWIAEQRQRC